MKNILSFIVGIMIIIFANTIYNFMNVYPKIDLSLIYIIILSLYWKGQDYELCAIALVLGYIVDVTSSMYQGHYTMLFFVISLLGIFIKDEIQKEYFSVPFIISIIFLMMSAVFNTIVTGLFRKGIAEVLVINMLYITVNMIALIIIIWIVNTIIKHWRIK